MVWTLFVLDMDCTYSNEDTESIGVQPLVYLIPLQEQKKVESCARKACDDFFLKDNENLDLCIADYFEEELKNDGIDFKLIGSIDLPFGERQVDYLADYIPREII